MDCAGWAAIVLVTMLVAPLRAVDKSWNTGDGSWYTASNWTPHGVPGVNDVIRIGNLPGVQNSTVSLTAPGAGYDFLEISGGMTLDMNGGELVSFEDAYITGELASDRPACARAKCARFPRRAARRSRCALRDAGQRACAHL